jgi:hypothetical protein
VVLGFSEAHAQSVLSTAPRDDLEQIHAAPFSAMNRCARFLITWLRRQSVAKRVGRTVSGSCVPCGVALRRRVRAP